MSFNITTIYRNHRQDILIGIVAGLIFSFTVYQGAQRVPTVILQPDRADIWFESDSPRVFDNMTWRGSDNFRSNVHPLFTLFTYPVVYFLKHVFSLGPITAVRLIIAFAAFLWIFSLFVLLRLMGCRRIDAVIFSLLGAVSAASVFFFAIPETYPFGSLTILFALILAILSQQYIISGAWYVLVNVLTLSITTSNWMSGILATIINHQFKRTAQILIIVFLIVTGLWGIEKAVFPTSKYFLDITEESDQLFRDNLISPLHVVQSFFYHTIVMPAIQVIPERERPAWPGMYTQSSAAGSGTVWGVPAVILWTTLLIFGIRALLLLKIHPKLRFTLGLTILGQLCMHMVYGTEIFLYSLHFVVLFIPMVALCTLTEMRTTALIVVCLLIFCVTINNVAQFNKALDYFQHYGNKAKSSAEGALTVK